MMAKEQAASLNGNSSITSEDEWTYSAGKEEEKNPEKPSLIQIHKLVKEAEELVRETPAKRSLTFDEVPLNKISRVKQWLNMDKPDDSCDASGEDEEKESRSSEELNESIATYRAALSPNGHNASMTSLGEEGSTPKVILRPSRYAIKGNRPWSVSCISQLSHPAHR